MENNNNPQQAVNQENGKTVAIVCYLTLIGWIIGVVLHGNNKTSLGAYHLRQMLGLMILALAVFILGFPLAFMPFLGWIISLTLNIGILVFWILGLVSAANGDEKPVPVIGDLFQKWFAGFGV